VRPFVRQKQQKIHETGARPEELGNVREARQTIRIFTEMKRRKRKGATRRSSAKLTHKGKRATIHQQHQGCLNTKCRRNEKKSQDTSPSQDKGEKSQQNGGETGTEKDKGE